MNDLGPDSPYGINNRCGYGSPHILEQIMNPFEAYPTKDQLAYEIEQEVLALAATWPGSAKEPYKTIWKKGRMAILRGEPVPWKATT